MGDNRRAWRQRLQSIRDAADEAEKAPPEEQSDEPQVAEPAELAEPVPISPARHAELQQRAEKRTAEIARKYS